MNNIKFITDRIEQEEGEIKKYRNELKYRIDTLSKMLEQNADAKWLEGEIEAIQKVCRDISVAETKIDICKLIVGNMMLD